MDVSYFAWRLEIFRGMRLEELGSVCGESSAAKGRG